MGNSSFCNYTLRCISAITNECDALAYKFPATPLEVECAAQGFKPIGSNGLMERCVAAVDGLFIKTITPTTSEVGNVRTLFSGHYHQYGLNIQSKHISC